MSQFDSVSVVKKANVYFDGKCISHTVIFPDGTRKTVGVILPSTLRFNTVAPELMEIVSGACSIRLSGTADWHSYTAGQTFSVPANSSFEIDVVDVLDYVCHFS